MRRVTGIGGIFFKAKDPKTLVEWYRTHLGMNVENWGGVAFRWADDNSSGTGTTIWSPFKQDTNYFAPSSAPFMVNFRVADLHALLEALRAEGCAVQDKVEESEFGKFGWVLDPEGNKLELWEPPSESPRHSEGRVPLPAVRPRSVSTPRLWSPSHDCL